MLWWLLYVTPFVLASYYFGGKLLRSVVIDKLNEQLNTQITVYSININGLRTFPKIGIELTNVRVKESTPHFGKNLLQARNMVVVFNPLKLMAGNYEIDRIEVSDGAARLFTGKDGLNNFTLFKPDSTSTEEALDINLKKVLLAGFQCVYVNELDDQSFNFKTHELALSGKFDQERFTLKTNGDALFDHLMLGGVDYILGKHCQMDLVLDVNQKIEAYHIEKGIISLDNLKLNVSGDILMVENEPDLDIELTGKNIDVQSVLSVLPNDIRYPLRGIKSSGQIDVNGKILGAFREDSWPSIDIEFAFNDAAATWEEKDLNIERLNLKGTLANTQSDDSKKLNLDLVVEEIRLKKSSLKGELSVHDLNHPDINFRTKGLVDLSDVKGFITTEEDETLFGNCRFNIKGGIPYNLKSNSSDFVRSDIDGDIEIHDLDYYNSSDTFVRDVQFTTRVKGNNLTRTEVTGEILTSDVGFKGVLKNWQGYLFKDQRLYVEGDLTSKYVRLDFGSDEEVDTTASAGPMTFDYGFDADVTLNIDTFNWGMVTLGHAKGKLGWTKSKIALNNTTFNAWTGENQLDGELVMTKNRFLLRSNSHSEGVKIEQLLDDFDNFAQEEFTSEILKGQLTTTIDLTMSFDRFFEVIEEDVKCLAEVDISDGQLKDYEPMEALSSFVELDNLKDIRFERLTNTIEISDRKINIPTMTVKNNAMNLDIGGTHSFDNYMNYRMKIRVTELLAKKSGWIKRKKERQLEDDNGGGLSAYILMVGTPDDLKIKYDRKAVKDIIKQEVKKERKEFFDQLKREIKREKTHTEDTKKVRWDE